MSLSFSTTAGRRLSTFPAAVRAGHPDELARLKAVVKEATKALPVERARLEALLAAERTWERAEWDRLYLVHPVTGHFARRLLWDFGHGRRWETARAGGDLPDAPLVRLWHPIRASVEEVARWRSDLVQGEVRQPFKQAFREVYRLTPAEEETAEYSNRFAAHVLRYPQAAALMRARGWKARSLGYWDGGYDGQTVREFPDAGLRAVFYYDLVQQEADRYGTPSLCTTDQVRFERVARAVSERVPSAEVPPLVLSEAMRDVDLFVGVTSIAADPERIDRGTDPRFDGAGTAHPSPPHRRPVPGHRPLLGRAGEPAELQDPHRRGQRADGTGRHLPVRRGRPPERPDLKSSSSRSRRTAAG